MPHTESPITVLRVRRTSVVNVEETQEVDFRLGTGQGVEIHAIEFGIRGFTHVPVDDDENANVQFHMSCHLETGGLEGGIDAFPADATILNSEIIAETSLSVRTFISSVAAASGSSEHATWTQPLSWNFHSLIGKPLLIAQNVTFRAITSDALFSVLGAQLTMYYKIKALSVKDIVNLFALRR